MRRIVAVLFVFQLFFSSASLSSDLEKEARIAEQTIQTLFVGEPLWLTTSPLKPAGETNKFLTLVTTTPNARGTVVLIHGTGQGPDTTFVIGPLREALSELEYHTLSIQMPVLSNEANYEDYEVEFPLARQRISAALNHLRGQSRENIYLLGHSMGSTMLFNWASEFGTDEVSAIVALGLGSIHTSDSSMKSTFTKVGVPVLDMYGEQDLKAVIDGADFRASLIESTHPQSKQVVLKDADHFFNGKGDLLAQTINQWLMSNSP